MTIGTATLESIRAIAHADGSTPLYIFDLAGMRRKLTSFVDSFERLFPHFTVAYSYKTNSARFVTRLVEECGQAAEVVSGPELNLAVADGFSADRIYFDGPVKSRDELALGLATGVRIQLDSWTELRTLCELAHLAEKQTRISLRGSVRKRRKWSRFGFTPDEMSEAVAFLARAGVSVSGFHFNLGAHQLDPAAYSKELRNWHRLLHVLLNQHSGPDRFVIDIGGGFPSLSAQRNVTLPPWSAYAEAVHQALLQMEISSNEVHLVAEPGRSLVEDFGYVVYGVAAEKRRGRRRLLIANGSGLLVSSRDTWYHPIALHPGGTSRYDVFGNACFEHDTIAKHLPGPLQIKPDQLIVVGSAGGYDVPSARGWIRDLPHVWATDDDTGPVRYESDDFYNESRFRSVALFRDLNNTAGGAVNA